MTLVELIVAMGILTVVLVVFMAAVASMAKTTVRSEALTDSSDQLRTVFERLDHEVRYASDINRPGYVGGSYYVEYKVNDAERSGSSRCVQWRYVTSSHELQRRTWDPLHTDDTLSSWSTMVTRLRNDLSTTAGLPFAFYPAAQDDSTGGKAYIRQRLRVHLDTGLGNAGDGRGGSIDTVLVAQNSSEHSVSNPDKDGDGVSDEPVCQDGVGRP